MTLKRKESEKRKVISLPGSKTLDGLIKELQELQVSLQKKGVSSAAVGSDYYNRNGIIITWREVESESAFKKRVAKERDALRKKIKESLVEAGNLGISKDKILKQFKIKEEKTKKPQARKNPKSNN